LSGESSTTCEICILTDKACERLPKEKAHLCKDLFRKLERGELTPKEVAEILAKEIPEFARTWFEVVREEHPELFEEEEA